jgi:hypothetical protein
MNSDLCIGIVVKKKSLEIAALAPGKPAVAMQFPASCMGIEALKIFLTSHDGHVRLAVAGVAALGLALALGNAPGRETFIVSCAVADQAVALARYAEHAV